MVLILICHSHVETIRIFQRQHVGQCHQGPDSFYLFQQCCFGIILLRDALHALVVLANSLAERFNFLQQRLRVRLAVPGLVPRLSRGSCFVGCTVVAVPLKTHGFTGLLTPQQHL